MTIQMSRNEMLKFAAQELYYSAYYFSNDDTDPDDNETRAHLRHTARLIEAIAESPLLGALEPYEELKNAELRYFGEELEIVRS